MFWTHWSTLIGYVGLELLSIRWKEVLSFTVGNKKSFLLNPEITLKICAIVNEILGETNEAISKIVFLYFQITVDR